MHKKIVVAGLTLDPKTRTPVVILRHRRSRRELHIRIGIIEASAIAYELEQVRLARPMAYDLLRNTVHALGGEVLNVRIVGLPQQRFAALLVLRHGSRVLELDARPSDGIVQALRARAPLYCDARLLAGAKLPAAPLKHVLGTSGVRAARSGVRPAVRRKETPHARVQAGKPRLRQQELEPMGPTGHAINLEHLRPEAFGKYKQ